MLHRPENSMTYSDTVNGIQIAVQPFYVPERSLPAHRVYFYAYAITLTNERNDACQLLRRLWVIKDGFGQEERIEGDGVVGKQPWIKPGESFKYASFCPLQTPHGNMRGKYEMLSEQGYKFYARIPLFFFRPPEHADATDNAV